MKTGVEKVTFVVLPLLSPELSGVNLDILRVDEVILMTKRIMSTVFDALKVFR